MSDIKANLYKCFYSLDEDFFADFLSNINKRIIFQKYGLIFATIFGLEFGSFSLYIHGPYNSSLATIGYEFAKNSLKRETRCINFTDSADKIINFLRQNLGTTDEHTNFIEVFSTYFYLKNYCNYQDDKAAQKTSSIKRELIEKNNIKIDCIKDTYVKIKEFINNESKQQLIA